MSDLKGNILIVDDDVDVLVALKLLLKRHGAAVYTETDPERIPGRLRDDRFDIILLDMNFTQDTATGREGFIWLDRILKIDPSAVVILITAFGDVDMAVRAIKEGAVDFIVKPWHNEKLVATVHSAMQLSSSRTELEKLRNRQQLLSADLDHGYEQLIGTSPAMLEVFSLIEKVAATDADVLILGENGTGKELVARALHRKSGRSGEVFVSVDIGSLTESLFESELFGYVKGAFTDAKRDRAGRFEAASGGTLFLDEIGNITPAQQSRLLRVLENRKVTRVGSNTSRDIDIRLICATNLPIMDMVSSGEFRQDLLYRINTVEILLPPLRDRLEDIPMLAEHFLQVYRKKYRRPKAVLTAATVNRLKKYHWPGNVRELQHAIERAVILCDASTLKPTDFFFATPEKHEDQLGIDSYNLEDLERRMIMKAINLHGGNIQAAARELGLTRPSLYRRMEKYGI